MVDIAIGAAAGAASGLLAASGAGVVVQAAVSAGISMASNAAQQANAIAKKRQDSFDVGDMLFDGAVGAVCGAAGGDGMGKSCNLKTLNKNLTKKVFHGSSETIKKGIKYYVSQTKYSYRNFLFKPMRKSTIVNLSGMAIKRVCNLLEGCNE